MGPTLSGTARSSMDGASVWKAGNMVRSLGDLFEVTQPIERERALHWILLASLIGLGTVVRFWGLGSVGLHGDEETMAMAVRHILVDGRPILPSGMFYPRGMTQLYLMAGSVALFGESEWSLRLPSVLCGIALIPLAYCASRRFLRPMWALALSAAVAFLPALVLDSQTARMYIFMVTLITACMLCLFAWERSGSVGWLMGAVAALIVSLDMHALSVAAVLMFLIPAVIRGDLRLAIAGAVGALLVAGAFVLIDGWVNAQYPTPPEDFVSTHPSAVGPSVSVAGFPLTLALVMAAISIAGVVSAWRVGRSAGTRWSAGVVIGLLLAGLGLQWLLFYHLAFLCYLAGAVLAVRFSAAAAVRRDLMGLAAAAALIMLCHAIWLAPRAATFVQLVGAMVGQPSVWPYAKIAQLSHVAALATAGLLGFGFWCIANRRHIPDYWLLAALGVWAPIFALGLFAWDVPPRYTAMSWVPMLVCAFAVMQRCVDALARSRSQIGAGWQAIVAVIAAVCIVNPAAVASSVNSGYAIRPDHKGAAEYMQAQSITDEDIVIAEDVLQQTYYLGKVDYWLIGPQVARRYVKRTDEGLVDFYTGTPVIFSSDMLDELLRNNPGKRVFIIGSGEDWRQGRRVVREGLHETLQSNRFTTVYTGRDGRTRVLRADSGALGSTPTLEPQGERVSASDDDGVAQVDTAAQGTEHAPAAPIGE